MEKSFITKTQIVTVVAWIIFGIWNHFVGRWEDMLPPSDASIRVDLVVIIPILLVLSLVSIIQIVRHFSKKSIRWFMYLILIAGTSLLLAVMYHLVFISDEVHIEAPHHEVSSVETVNLQEANLVKITDKNMINKLDKIFLVDDYSVKTSYLLQELDLNNDGKPEWLVSQESSTVCGTGGCPFYVLTNVQSQAEIVLDFAPAMEVAIAQQESNGWKKIYITIGDGGSAPEKIEMVFNGKKYDFSEESAKKIEHETGDDYDSK